MFHKVWTIFLEVISVLYQATFRADSALSVKMKTENLFANFQFNLSCIIIIY